MSNPNIVRDKGQGTIGLTRKPKTTPGCLGLCDDFANTQRGILVAQARSSSEISVVAGFDQENGVIWANEGLLQAIDRAHKTKTKLIEIHVQTLAHEFAHVWQHKDILARFTDRKNIKSDIIKIAFALRQQIAERVQISTEFQFIQYYLDKEKEAEKIANTITAELRQHRKQLPRNSKSFYINQSTDTWFYNLRQSYEKQYRGLYVKTKEQLMELGDSAQKVAAESDKKPKYSQKLLPLYKMIAYDIFPGKEESITLHNLLEIIKEYNAVIVVSGVIESK